MGGVKNDTGKGGKVRQEKDWIRGAGRVNNTEEVCQDKQNISRSKGE